MGTLVNAVKQQMLDTLRTDSAPALQASHVSLHTADPRPSGGAELDGGEYARQAVSWSPASGGTLAASNSPEFNIPASTTVSHYGLWTASTEGTFLGGGPLSSSETFNAAGTYTLDATDVTIEDPS